MTTRADEGGRRKAHIPISPYTSPLAGDVARAAVALLGVTSVEAGEAGGAQLATRAERAAEQLLTHLGRVIGEIGVSALFKRSIVLASTQYPWLAATPAGATPGAAIHAAMLQADPDAARAGFSAVLTTFVALLARLIGDGLVRALLAELWPDVFRSEKETV